MRQPIIIGIGELFWNILPERRFIAGAPVNVIYHAAKQGAEALAISAVGEDCEGQDIIDALTGRELSTQHIVSVPGYPTGTVSVELSDGIPSYNIHAPAAWDFIPWSDRLQQLAEQADAVCFGLLSQRKDVTASTVRSFLEATKPGCLRVLDLNLNHNFCNKKVVTDSLRRSIEKVNARLSD